MFKKIKAFLTKKSRIGQLEDEVADMKARIFKKGLEETMMGLSSLMSNHYFGGFYSDVTKPLEEDFFDNLELLEDKINLLAKHMGVKFVRVQKSDEYMSLESTKVRKTKKK